MKGCDSQSEAVNGPLLQFIRGTSSALLESVIFYEGTNTSIANSSKLFISLVNTVTSMLDAIESTCS